MPEALLHQNGTAIRSFRKILPKLHEELQLRYHIGIGVRASGLWGHNTRTAELRALAENTEACLPLLRKVICWYQHYAPSSSSGSDVHRFPNSQKSWDNMDTSIVVVGVKLEQVWGFFFGDTPVEQPLNISHPRRRPPHLV